jgi:hypothetical protein
MAQIGVSCPRGLISWEECLGSCAPNPLHPCNYTPDVLELMRIDYTDPDREPGVESFTPTRVLGCARQPVLMGESDYHVDVDSAYKMVRGNMVHALIQTARYPGAVTIIREQRMKVMVQTKYGQQLFTAKPDLIVVTRIDPGPDDNSCAPVVHVRVVDYKSTNEIAHQFTEPKLDHQLQVNMYAWVASQCLLDYLPHAEHLAQDAVVQVDGVELAHFAMNKTRRFVSEGPRLDRGKMLTRNPKTFETITLAPITLWDMDLVGQFIARKIEERIEAEIKLPDILEGDAAWRCDYCPVRNLCYQIGNQR